MQIAIYGKGGIGKSTVSANLSAALASLGHRVLQIGCDPKHDSTRLLHHGQRVTTVLDYILNTPPDDQKASDILMEGYLGTGCIEAGGPRPGKGCAGRGILTSFDFLNRHSVFSGYDTIVYDVLGDVVCGGFAVPVRPQYAQAIFLVTSGEAMSIYAANNILSGIRNLDEGGSRIAGIIYNSRGAGDDKNRVTEFAEAVGIPVCLSIPRSEAFLKAERQALTQVEMDRTSEEAKLFLQLAEKIAGGFELHPAEPLDEEQMEAFMQGRKIEKIKGGDKGTEKSGPPSGCENCPQAEPAAEEKDNAIRPIPKKRALSDPFSRMPLFGCAFRGAVDLAVQVKDAAVLGHAPKSCTSYAVNGITSYGRNGLYTRGIIYPAFVPQHFENTDINIHDAVFGGVEHAREKALALASQGIKDIIAVTACIPGLSGDDLAPLKEELRQMGVEMYIVKSDGVEEGSYNDGMALCYKTLAREAVKPAAVTDKDSVNIVYELSWSLKTQDDFLVLKSLLGEMGIRVNCRFLYDTSIRDINGFLRAPYSIMAREEKLGLEIKKIFEDSYGCRFLKETMPRGFAQSVRFVGELGRAYSKEEAAEEVISKYTSLYRERLEKIRGSYEGKRVMVFENSPVPWLEDLIQDLRLDVVGSFLPGKSDGKDPEWRHRFTAEWKQDVESFSEKMKELVPDLVLSTDSAVLSEAGRIKGCRAVPVGRNIGVGFLSGLDEAERWLEGSAKELKGRWRNDRTVFEKYNA